MCVFQQLGHEGGHPPLSPPCAHHWYSIVCHYSCDAIQASPLSQPTSLDQVLLKNLSKTVYNLAALICQVLAGAFSIVSTTRGLSFITKTEEVWPA